MRTLLILSFATFLSITVRSQEVITLEKVVATSLQNNHGIIAAKNNIEIANNNATVGNAGLLPQVGANAGFNGGINNSKIEFAGNNPDLEVDGATSRSTNASLNLNYTIFSGFSGRNTYKKLKGLNTLTETQTQLAIENTLMQVINGYYLAAKFQEQLLIAENALVITKERLERVNNQFEFGTANKLAVLNAQVDLNTDSVNLINTQLNFNNSIRNLMFLMGDTNGETFVIDTIVSFSLEGALDELINKSLQNNASVLAAAHTLTLSEYDLKISQSRKYPTLSLNSSYGYNQSANDGSFIAQSSSVGFSGGLSLSYNLFNGKQATINAQNAKINIESNTEKKLEAEDLVRKEVKNTYDTYQTRLAILAMEKQNKKTAKVNFERSKIAFELGQITTTQFREAQLNLIRSQNRINTAKFDAKLSEMDLIRLAGMLIE
ncbi:TolC family protein [Flavobacteriales bacterium]|nr:TolC family protein [Flavobacteriales bacterium]